MDFRASGGQAGRRDRLLQAGSGAGNGAGAGVWVGPTGRVSQSRMQSHNVLICRGTLIHQKRYGPFVTPLIITPFSLLFFPGGGGEERRDRSKSYQETADKAA